MGKALNIEKGKQGFQPRAPQPVAPPTPAATTATRRAAVTDTPRDNEWLNDVYHTYLDKATTAADTGDLGNATESVEVEPSDSGVVDTRRFGTYHPNPGRIEQWQVTEGFTVEWRRNPLVPGRDTAHVELDIPELSGRHNDVRELLQDNRPGEALRMMAARLRQIADDMDTHSDNLD